MIKTKKGKYENRRNLYMMMTEVALTPFTACDAYRYFAAGHC